MSSHRPASLLLGGLAALTIAAVPAPPAVATPAAARTVRTFARSLGPGRTRLELRMETPFAATGSTPVRWYLRASGSRVYRLVTSTASAFRAPDWLVASAVVDPPARRFSYRVCLNPPWERLMGATAAHGACPSGDFEVGHAGAPTAAFQYGGHGAGIPIRAVPGAGAIAAAIRYLDGRAGRTSFAVVDSSGHLAGARLHEHFETASLLKVMLLVGELQRLARARLPLDPERRGLLYPMIHESNNAAASAVLSRIGWGTVESVAGQVGMQDFARPRGWWAFTQTSAADQARLASQLPALIPTRFYGYARYLLSTIEPQQSWGIPTVARSRWQVFFKTGQLPSQGLFNEDALLERGTRRVAIAVLTDGDPSMAYGEQTIAGLGAVLLGGA